MKHTKNLQIEDFNMLQFREPLKFGLNRELNF